MATTPTSEVKAAITMGAIAEIVLLAIGGIVYWYTDHMVWLLGLALAGSAVMLLLLAQAGAFKKRDDQ